eukprot:m.438630 g.438630  ORF g.438630 m.438630 type:complete len:60 (+) comp114809_c0_seq1:146-325(+)
MPRQSVGDHARGFERFCFCQWHSAIRHQNDVKAKSFRCTEIEIESTARPTVQLWLGCSE